KGKQTAWELRKVSSVTVPKLDVLIRSGSRLYAGAEGQVLAYDLPLREGRAKPSWQAKVDGRPAQLVVRGGHPVVSTRRGRLSGSGGEEGDPKTDHRTTAEPPAADEWTEKAQSILSTRDIQDGYCIAWGVGSGRLVEEILRHSRLRVVVVEPDADRVASFRK